MCGLHAGHFDGGEGGRDCLYWCSIGTGTNRTTWRATIPGRNPVAVHELEVYSGEANGLLEKRLRPLLKTRRLDRYGVCYKCGDLHTNLSRHKSGCDRTLLESIPPHSDGLSCEPFARNPATPSTPALQWKDPIKANSLHRADFCRGE